MAHGAGGPSRARTSALVAQVIPPALLLVLFIAPWDAAWLGFWMAGALAATLSALGLTVRLAMKRTGGTEPLFEWRTMTRPVLTIAIVAAAAAMAALFEAEAARYADVLIAQLQQSCKARTRCPAAPEGWTTSHGHAFNRHGRWSFTYLTDASRTQFALFVHKRSEQELCIYGSAQGVVRFTALQCMTHGGLPEEHRT